MRELKSLQESFKDAMAYMDECKKRPDELKIRVAHLKTAPSDWDEKKFGK